MTTDELIEKIIAANHKVIDEVREHAKKVLTEEEFFVYHNLVDALNRTSQALVEQGKVHVWNEVLATMNRFAVNNEEILKP